MQSLELARLQDDTRSYACNGHFFSMNNNIGRLDKHSAIRHEYNSSNTIVGWRSLSDLPRYRAYLGLISL